MPRRVCAAPARQCRASGCTTGDFVARWRARLVPSDLLRGQWPVRVLVNDAVFWLVFIAAVVVVFNPGHAVLIGRALGFDWPGMAFRWAGRLLCDADARYLGPAFAPPASG